MGVALDGDEVEDFTKAVGQSADVRDELGGGEVGEGLGGDAQRIREEGPRPVDRVGEGAVGAGLVGAQGLEARGHRDAVEPVGEGLCVAAVRESVERLYPRVLGEVLGVGVGGAVAGAGPVHGRSTGPVELVLRVSVAALGGCEYVVRDLCQGWVSGFT